MARITPELAREYAARSAQVRAERKRRAEEAFSNPAATTAPSEEYAIRRLMRVRAQLDKVDRMIAEERDPVKLDRLASTSARLEEQERRLSNRSLPPTLKAPARQRSRPAAPGPLDA